MRGGQALVGLTRLGGTLWVMWGGQASLIVGTQRACAPASADTQPFCMGLVVGTTVGQVSLQVSSSVDSTKPVFP